MKAQSLRRVLTLANVGLALAILGAGAWYVVKIRPAAADDAQGSQWLKASADAHRIDENSAKPSPSWSVDDQAFESLTRPDLMDRKRGPGVWEFIGPVPPKFVPVSEPNTAAPKSREGLAATVRLIGLILDRPDGRSVITVAFNGPKGNHRTYAVGDGNPIADVETRGVEFAAADAVRQKRVPGKYLVTVEVVGEEDGCPQVKLVYDEITDPDKAPECKAEILALAQDAQPMGRFAVPVGGPTPSAKSPFAGPVAPEDPTGPQAPQSIAKGRVEPKELAPNVYAIEFTQEQFDRFSGIAREDLIKDLKTADVRDDRGGGVRADGMSPESVASQFGVQPGDILRSINGDSVHSRADVVAVIQRIPKDVALVTVVLTRDGQDRTYRIDPRDPKVRAGAGRVILKPAPKK